MHKSGFVNIVGRPNVGKSTLMNALVGEQMSIITNKPQTTRHRIVGIVNNDDFQIIFSDTPGVIDKPAYKMQEAMNRFVMNSFEDADLVLFTTEPNEVYKEDDPILELLKKTATPIYLVLNKIDTINQQKVEDLIQFWKNRLNFKACIPIAALHKFNTDTLLQQIVKIIPEGPKYYPEDQLTDRPERFFVSEIIREKILQLYSQEIPYSCEVAIESFEETTNKVGEPFAKIRAVIFVSRQSQKSIIIGKYGGAIKKLGIEARKSIETYLTHSIFLELHVKVKDNWRDDERALKFFGYE